MTATIGSILQKEREIRGLSLAQAAEATHIRADRLHDLESDDFSNFPNPAYARMYFRLYCKYLDIQLTDEIDLLFPGALAGLDDYEYLRNEPVAPPARATRPKRPRRSLAFLAAASLVMLIVFTALALSLVWTVQRIGEWGAVKYAEIQATIENAKLADPPSLPGEALDPEAPTVETVEEPVDIVEPMVGTLPAPSEEPLAISEGELIGEAPTQAVTEGAAAPPGAMMPPPDGLPLPADETPPPPMSEVELSGAPIVPGGETPAEGAAPAEPEVKETPFAFPDPSPEASD